jgi:hypothetical protein
MKTVASDVPPTGTFWIGTGKASATVEAARSANSARSSLAVGSEDARLASAVAEITAATIETGRKTGRRRSVSREMRHSGRPTGFGACASWVPICGSPCPPGAAPGLLVPYFQANYAISSAEIFGCAAISADRSLAERIVTPSSARWG